MRFMVVLLGLWVFASLANAQSQWLQLPPTPALPKAEQSGYAPINGVRIWYAEFGHWLE